MAGGRSVGAEPTAVTLDPRIRKALENAARRWWAPTVRRQAATVLGYVDGKSLDQISASARLRREEAERIITDYRKGGLDGVRLAVVTVPALFPLSRNTKGMTIRIVSLAMVEQRRPGASLPVCQGEELAEGIRLASPAIRATPEILRSFPGTGIEVTPGVCGGSARIAGTRIPVWTLVEARNLGASEAQALIDYPSLSASDLVNAWAFAKDHAAEIAARIRSNAVA